MFDSDLEKEKARELFLVGPNSFCAHCNSCGLRDKFPMRQYSFHMCNLRRGDSKPRFPPLPREQSSPEKKLVHTPDPPTPESEFHFVEIPQHESPKHQPSVGSTDPWTESDPWGGAGAKRARSASTSGPIHYDMAARDSVSAGAGSADPDGTKCPQCNQPSIAEYHPHCWSCGWQIENGTEAECGFCGSSDPNCFPLRLATTVSSMVVMIV